MAGVVPVTEIVIPHSCPKFSAPFLSPPLSPIPTQDPLSAPTSPIPHPRAFCALFFVVVFLYLVVLSLFGGPCNELNFTFFFWCSLFLFFLACPYRGGLVSCCTLLPFPPLPSLPFPYPSVLLFIIICVYVQILNERHTNTPPLPCLVHATRAVQPLFALPRLPHTPSFLPPPPRG